MSAELAQDIDTDLTETVALILSRIPHWYPEPQHASIYTIYEQGTCKRCHCRVWQELPFQEGVCAECLAFPNFRYIFRVGGE